MKTKFLCPRFPSLKVVVKPDTHVLREGIPYFIRGKKVQFEKGVLITDDEDVMKRIRSSEKFGSSIVELTVAEQKKIDRRAKVEAKHKKLIDEEIKEEEAKEKV